MKCHQEGGSLCVEVADVVVFVVVVGMGAVAVLVGLVTVAVLVSGR